MFIYARKNYHSDFESNITLMLKNQVMNSRMTESDENTFVQNVFSISEDLIFDFSLNKKG